MEPRKEVALSVLAYSLCSGTLVLFNKLTLHHLPYPSLVVSFQLLATLLFIAVAAWIGKLPVDPLRWKFVVPYLYYIIAFAAGVYCNMRSLSESNVETIIVFRALSPVVVAFLDAIFLGREYPSLRSWSALTLIVLGAYGYASFDEKFQTQGAVAYAWPSLYVIIISFEMAYGKRIIRSVDLKTRSGPVLYTNLLGIWPMLLFAGMGNEYGKFWSDRVEEQNPIGVTAAILLLLGCVAGIGIGYSAWWCRDKVSATSFTIVGVMNKCLTVLLNLLVWDKHAPAGGIACLVLCLVGGSIYKQAPMRQDTNSSTREALLDQGKDILKSDLSLEDHVEEGEGGKDKPVHMNGAAKHYHPPPAVLQDTSETRKRPSAVVTKE